MRWMLVLALLLLALAGCGSTVEVREPDLVVRGEQPTQTPPAARRDALAAGTPRIAVVTHGQAANPFWVIVRNGIDAAARQLDVSVSYSSPDTFSVARMRSLIDAAVDTRPDGLVVSIPNVGVEDAIERAVRAGIPVVSINSGSDASRRLGVLAHIGQPEARAGALVGERLARAGVRRGLCVNQETRNAGLNLRCRAFARVIRRAGGQVRMLVVDFQDRPGTRRRLAEAIASGNVDGVLTLGAQGAIAALAALRASPRGDDVRLATFDLAPEILEAVRDGRMEFAVDQQGYLQGYLPIVLLTQKIRFGIFADEGSVIPTGPIFVTEQTAGQVLSLSERGIR